MNEKQIIEKIYQKLDGELKGAGLEEFDRFLEEHPPHYQTFLNIQRMENSLISGGKNPEVIDLKGDILKQINMDKYNATQNEPIVRLKTSFWARPAVRFSFPFALGIITGILLLVLLQTDFNQNPGSESGMAGTLYDSRSFDNMKTAGILDFDSPVVKTMCHVKYSTKLVEMRIELSSLDAVTARIEFDPGSVGILNVINVNVNEQTSVYSASSYIRIDNVGDNNFIIQLANKTSLTNEIDLKIFQNEFPVYQNAVQINQ